MQLYQLVVNESVATYLYFIHKEQVAPGTNLIKEAQKVVSKWVRYRSINTQPFMTGLIQEASSYLGFRNWLGLDVGLEDYVALRFSTHPELHQGLSAGSREAMARSLAMEFEQSGFVTYGPIPYRMASNQVRCVELTVPLSEGFEGDSPVGNVSSVESILAREWSQLDGDLKVRLSYVVQPALAMFGWHDDENQLHLLAEENAVVRIGETALNQGKRVLDGLLTPELVQVVSSLGSEFIQQRIYCIYNLNEQKGLAIFQRPEATVPTREFEQRSYVS